MGSEKIFQVSSNKHPNPLNKTEGHSYNLTKGTCETSDSHFRPSGQESPTTLVLKEGIKIHNLSSVVIPRQGLKSCHYIDPF